MNASIEKFAKAIEALDRLLSDRPNMAKSAGLLATVASLREADAGFREIDARLTVLEKQASDEQAARYGFGVADSDRARVAQLESELAVLQSRHEPVAHVAGLAKALGLGRATQAPRIEQSPPAGGAADPWRQ